jgi:hypothetical protein
MYVVPGIKQMFVGTSRLLFNQVECRVARCYILKPQNPNLGKFWSALHTMKDVGKFYGPLFYCTAISYILWPIDIFCDHFGIFFPVLVSCTQKIWQPWLNGLATTKSNQLDGMFAAWNLIVNFL